MHVFDGFIVSSSEARDTSSHFLPHSLSPKNPSPPAGTCTLETCRCRWLSLVFCLTPPKKNNRWKWAQSAPKSPSCLSISHTCYLTHTDTLPLYLWLVWLSLLWPRTWMTFHNFIKVCTMQRRRWQAEGRIGGDRTKRQRERERERVAALRTELRLSDWEWDCDWAGGRQWRRRSTMAKRLGVESFTSPGRKQKVEWKVLVLGYGRESTFLLSTFPLCRLAPFASSLHLSIMNILLNWNVVVLLFPHDTPRRGSAAPTAPSHHSPSVIVRHC